MARWEIKNVNIAGVSMAVPEHTVKTADIDLFTPWGQYSFIDGDKDCR